MNFDNFTAADARAAVLHNKNVSLFLQAVECINDAIEAELRQASLEVGYDIDEAQLLAAVLIDRGFVVTVLIDHGDDVIVKYMDNTPECRYHLNIVW